MAEQNKLVETVVDLVRLEDPGIYEITALRQSGKTTAIISAAPYIDGSAVVVVPDEHERWRNRYPDSMTVLTVAELEHGGLCGREAPSVIFFDDVMPLEGFGALLPEFRGGVPQIIFLYTPPLVEQLCWQLRESGSAVTGPTFTVEQIC